MRFIIDKQARRSYLFADIESEEISLKIVYSHLVGQLPNNVKYFEAQKKEGFQKINACIEFSDSSIYRRS